MCKVNTRSEIFLSLFLFGQFFFFRNRNLEISALSCSHTCRLLVWGPSSLKKNCQAKPSSICARRSRIKLCNNTICNFFFIFLHWRKKNARMILCELKHSHTVAWSAFFSDFLYILLKINLRCNLSRYCLLAHQTLGCRECYFQWCVVNVRILGAQQLTSN